MQDKKRFLFLQKKLQKNLENELLFLEKNKNKELKKYETNFHKQFKIKKILLTKTEALLRSCKVSDYILMGDYHPFYQSQKAALRLLEQLHPIKKNLVLCVEFIFTEYQQELDYFLQKKITLEELREAIHYEENWPFSWEPYAELLLLARNKKIPVLALNIRPTHKRNALQERDKAAALTISKHKKSIENKSYFIFYGELHLSEAFLPFELKKTLPLQKKNTTIIYQNINNLYWLLHNKRKPTTSELVKLSQNKFCILNAAPWIKLQAYLDWLEGCSTQSVENDTIIADPFSKIVQYADFIKSILNISEPLNANYTFYDSDTAQQLNSILEKQKKNSWAPLLDHCATHLRPLFHYDSKSLFNPTNSLNNMSELAAQMIFHSKQKHSYLKENPKELYFRLIVYFLRSYLGSKIVNPKRKCNEINDIEEYLEKNYKKKHTLRGWKKLKYQAFDQAHISLRIIYQKQSRTRKTLKRSPIAFEAARTSGFLLGQRIFDQFSAQNINTDELKEIFLKNPRTENAALQWLFYLQKNYLQKKIFFKSKKEKF